MSTITDVGTVALTADEWEQLAGRVPLLVSTVVWSLACDSPMSPQVTGGRRAVYWCHQTCGEHQVDMPTLDGRVWALVADYRMRLPRGDVEQWKRWYIGRDVERVNVAADGTPTIEWRASAA